MIAFIAAEKEELSGIERHLTHQRPAKKWPLQYAVMGTLNRRKTLLAANGPGSKLVRLAIAAVRQNGCQENSRPAFGQTREWEEKEKLEAIVSVGFCGALNPELGPADIFVASEIIGIGTLQVPFRSKPPRGFGKLLTVDRVITTIEEKRRLRRTGADAVDMEAAALARLAAEWSTPFYCVRAVTDTADEAFGVDFNRTRDAEGRFSRWRIVLAACRKPSRHFPELMKLERRCKRAAVALGEFIADCQF